jgi:transcriptional regulator with XRE-family HTH domain
MNLSASQLADATGIQRSSVSHVLSGRNKASLDFVTKIILAFPEISSEWLMTGKGKMLKMENEEGTKKPPSGQQTEIDMLLRSENEAPYERKADPEPEIVLPKRKAGSKTSTTGSNSVEKIIILYADGTFIEYVPQG